MSRNDVILGVVAGVLVVFSLVVALVLPRRRPGFPGKNLRLFTLVSVLLVAAMLTAVEVLGESHHFGEEARTEAAEGPEGAERPTETGTDTTATTETGPAAEQQGDPAAGGEVFASAGCGSCHVLEEAGTTGTVGPSLDDSDVTFDEAVEQIRNGGGGMPPFGGQLSEQEIQDVAAFVVESAEG